MNKDLINHDLFGNDAGEDENLEVLNSYFLDKPEFSPFFDPLTRLGFVRSRKGMGKSALLRQIYFRRRELDEGEILIYIKASDLVALQDIDSSSPATLIHGWQQRICSRINYELGQAIRFAGSDDSITLVEGAELNGFRDRNLVSALFDRLKLKAKGVELTRERIQTSDSEVLMRRFVEKKEIRVWILIDDIDATFLNTEVERLKTSTFFSGCRNLVSSVNGLNIRASVRTDVWTILRQYDEALDKCEQYMLDPKWSTENSGTILRNKISAFYLRTYGKLPPFEPVTRAVFQEPMPWGQTHLESFRPIHILSAGRPRWATQLCRLAGKSAFQLHRPKIGISDITACMKEYGKSRLSDLYKEHRHQCSRLEVIVESFSGGPSQFTTQELVSRIKVTVVDKFGMPAIDGIEIQPRELAIAHFLFRVGFISARDDKQKNHQSPLSFVQYEDRPYLLTGRQNLDDGLPWEIHPSYRSVLNIQGGTLDEITGRAEVRRSRRVRHPKHTKDGIRNNLGPPRRGQS